MDNYKAVKPNKLEELSEIIEPLWDEPYNLLITLNYEYMNPMAQSQKQRV